MAAIGPAVEKLFADHPLRDGETAGVDEEVALLLNPPPLSPWWMYAGVASGLSVLVAAALAGTVNAALFWGAYPALEAQGRDGGVDFASVTTGRTVITATFVTAVALGLLGAALTSGSFVLFPFTDFEGYGDQEAS